MEPLSRNKKIGILSLVVLSLTLVGLFGTGKLSLSGLKSDALNAKPSITVLSPNGREVINLQAPLVIKLKTNNVYPAKHYINLVDEKNDIAFSLDSLLGKYGVTFTASQIQEPYQSIKVNIPDIYKLNTDNKYSIEICVQGICDRSNNLFKVISGPICPQIMPPPPGWCKGGTIQPGGKDKNGCDLPAICVPATK